MMNVLELTNTPMLSAFVAATFPVRVLLFIPLFMPMERFVPATRIIMPLNHTESLRRKIPSPIYGGANKRLKFVRQSEIISTVSVFAGTAHTDTGRFVPAVYSTMTCKSRQKTV